MKRIFMTIRHTGKGSKSWIEAKGNRDRFLFACMGVLKICLSTSRQAYVQIDKKPFFYRIDKDRQVRKL